MDRSIQNRIARRIAIIIGAFVMLMFTVFGAVFTLDSLNADLRTHRAEVRDFFKALTLFQANVDRMDTASGSLGRDAVLLDVATFDLQAIEARGHLREIGEKELGAYAERLSRL